MDKITFSNKVDTKVTAVAEINKVTGANLNEIKNVANLAVDQLELNTPQIASNKEDITSLINGNGKTYISISDAMAVLPLPSDNTPFTIRDSISNLEDGYYIYLSTEVGGYKFLEALQALANGYYVVNSLLDFDSLISNASAGVWMIISDITLDANKTIPAGVTLQFRNAKINLGGFTLTGTNTKIDAGLTQIFDISANLEGEWNVIESYTEWFGAVGDGIVNDTIPIQSCVNNFDFIVFDYNKIYYANEITATSFKSINLNGSTIHGDGKSAFINMSFISIFGGTIGSETKSYTDSSVLWENVNILNVKIWDITFVGNDITNSLVYSLQSNNIKHKKLSINNCLFNGFKRSGIEINATPFGSELEKITINNCVIHGTEIELGSKRGIQLGNNNERVSNVIVSNCKIRNLSGFENNEVKGILVYGNNILIQSNTIDSIYNTGGDDAEGIYVKATNVRILNNYLKNAGSSHDGVITIKGTDGTGDQYSEYAIISNNNIEFDNDLNDAMGVGIGRSFVIVTNNTLKDMRSNRGNLLYSIAIGLGTSEAVSDIILSENISTGFKNFIGSDSYNSRVGNNININGNIVSNIISSFGRLRADCKIEGTDWVFDSVSKQITFGLFSSIRKPVYDVGSTIVISGTSSNNGTFTIAEIIDSLNFTVLETITDETNLASSVMVLEIGGSIQILNNIIQAKENTGSNFIFEITGSTPFTSFTVSNNTINDFYRIAYFLSTSGKFYNLDNIGNVYGYTGASNAIITNGVQEYESFIPEFNTGNTSITYDSQVGEYSFDGDRVSMDIELKWSSAVFNTSNLQIDIPINVDSFGIYNTQYKGVCALYIGGLKVSPNEFSLVARSNYIRFMFLNGDGFFDGNEIFTDTLGGLTIHIEFKRV